MEEKFEQLIHDMELIIERAKSVLKESEHSLLLINIASEYNTTVTLIKSDKRKQPLPDCRAIFAYLALTKLDLRKVDISKILHRHHSSVLAMIARYNDLFETDPTFRDHALSITKDTFN